MTSFYNDYIRILLGYLEIFKQFVNSVNINVNETQKGASNSLSLEFNVLWVTVLTYLILSAYFNDGFIITIREQLPY